MESKSVCDSSSDDDEEDIPLALLYRMQQSEKESNLLSSRAGGCLSCEKLYHEFGITTTCFYEAHLQDEVKKEPKKRGRGRPPKISTTDKRRKKRKLETNSTSQKNLVLLQKTRTIAHE